MDWILRIHYSSFIMAVVLVSAFAFITITACDLAHGHHIMVLADNIDDGNDGGDGDDCDYCDGPCRMYVDSCR